MTEQVLFDTHDAATYLGCSPQFLRKCRCYQTGPVFVRLGTRSIRYRVSDLDAYIQQGLCEPRRRAAVGA